MEAFVCHVEAFANQHRQRELSFEGLVMLNADDVKQLQLEELVSVGNLFQLLVRQVPLVLLRYLHQINL